MPEMTGVEFLKKIIDLNPEPNRILLTGFSDFEALSSAVNEGKIYQYINKPWDESELKPVIYQALESYYIKKENQMLTKAIHEKNEILEREINQKNEVMTQLRLSEQELRTAKEKAEESDRLKTSFLNNMSHEIRTPLNGIVGFAELLCDNDLQADERLTFYSYIERNSRDLTEIISKVVLLSQIESGLEKLMLEITDGKKILLDVFNEFAQIYSSPKLRFQFLYLLPENDQKLVLDKCKMREIVFQLLENASKFTEKGQINLTVKRVDDKLRITVTDTGIGIPEEESGKRHK
jgi:signal transduction histidine kinase